jgi:hypothetical protein
MQLTSASKTEAILLSEQWGKNGFTNPRFAWLRSQRQTTETMKAKASGFTFFIPHKSDWSINLIIKYAQHLPLRLSECHIELDPILVIFAKATSPFEKISRNRPFPRAPFYIFTHQINRLANGQASGGVTLLDKNGNSYIVIPSHSPSEQHFQPEQTIAHELGHIAGFSHTPRTDQKGKDNIDLMQPNGCWYCSFSPSQCSSLRRYFQVQP